MYSVRQNKKFKKSIKKLVRSGRVVKEEIQILVNILANSEKLDSRYKDHELQGDF